MVGGPQEMRGVVGRKQLVMSPEDMNLLETNKAKGITTASVCECVCVFVHVSVCVSLSICLSVCLPEIFPER